jgi:hypothetical protein
MPNRYFNNTIDLINNTRARASDVEANFDQIEDGFDTAQAEMDLKANAASPNLTGTPTAPTAAPGTNTTQIATTAFVHAERTNAAALTNKTINLANNTLQATSAQIAAAVADETGSGALVFSNSPSLTGAPTVPTATDGTNTTQAASTAFVGTAIVNERTATATLTNKTLTSPAITGGTITGTAISGTASINVQRFTGDGVTTAFTLAQTPFSENNTQVYIDGVYQQKDTYSLAGTTLTFSEAPDIGLTNPENIEVVSTATQQIGATSADLVSYTPSGTGAVATNVQSKLREFVSVKDFGAVGDGVADDTTAIRNAMLAGSSVDFGGEQNTYRITNDLPVVTGGRYLASGATIFQSDVTKEIFVGTNVEDVLISGFTLLGASPNPLTTDGTNRAIEIYGPKKIRIENNIIKNWGSAGIFLSGSTDAGALNGPEDCIVQGNVIDNTTNAIFFYVGGSGNLICNNIISNSGRTGIFLDDVSLSSTDTAAALFTTLVSNNYVRDYGVFATGAGITSGQIKNCAIIGNVIEGGAGNGISLFAGGDSTQTPQACVGVLVDSNQIYDVTRSAIAFVGVEQSVIQNNLIFRPWRGATGANAGIDLQAATANAVTVGSTNNRVCNNKLVADTGDMDYGIRLRADCNNNIVRDNDIAGALVATAAVLDQGTGNSVQRNRGFVTENKGTATILSGTTSIVVTHGCNYTPDAGDISLVPTGTLGSAAFFFVTSITSTNFTINVNVDPATNVTFAWAVRRV